MLELIVPAVELYDENKEEFIYLKETTIKLEHSLVSMSKWESKWKVPFLRKIERTPDQTIDYIKCMTITQNIDDRYYNSILSNSLLMSQVNEYIEDLMTATTFHKNNTPSNNIVTSEVIYYYMISLNIPFECQKWHLNKLLTLIQVINIKNGKSTPMSQSEVISRNKSLNEARKAAMNSKG